MDAGPTDGPPGNQLRSVTVHLSSEEALSLIESLKEWAAEVDRGGPDPDWHAHLAGGDGAALTNAIPTS